MDAPDGNGIKVLMCALTDTTILVYLTTHTVLRVSKSSLSASDQYQIMSDQEAVLPVVRFKGYALIQHHLQYDRIARVTVLKPLKLVSVS